jgi:hypothetical protein
MYLFILRVVLVTEICSLDHDYRSHKYNQKVNSYFIHHEGESKPLFGNLFDLSSLPPFSFIRNNEADGLF